MTADLENKYLQQLKAATQQKNISESDRKGLLMIAQQFDRYKKAYDVISKAKDALETERAKLLKGVERLEQQRDEKKKQNSKDRKEIEKLKVTVEQL